MSKSLSILLFGHDAALLQTRRLILERSGFQVWSTWDLPGVETVISTQNIDLFILCHTVSLEDRAKAAVIVKALNLDVITFIMMELLPLHGGAARSKGINSFVSTSSFLAAVKEVIWQHKIIPRSMD